MQELMLGDYGNALKFYTEAFTIISLARAQWPQEIDMDGCGTSMRRTFSESLSRHFRRPSSDSLILSYQNDPFVHECWSASCRSHRR